MGPDEGTVFSPISPQEALHHTPSAREKEVRESDHAVPDPTSNMVFSPISPLAVKSSPITDYEERPQEAPQALTTETHPIEDDKDNAVNAPQVLEVDRSPPFIVDFQQKPATPPSAAVHSDTLTNPDVTSRDAPTAGSPVSLSAVESGDTGNAKEAPPPAKDGKIMGLKKRTFWIVLAVILAVIIAAAVGGGVGGSMANRNSASNSENNPTPTEPEQPQITGWNLTIYSERNFTGDSRVLDTIGLYNINFAADVPASDPAVLLQDPFGNGTYNSTICNSYVWRSSDSGCCVKFCMNNTDIGFRCRTESENPSSSFDKVALACGGEPDASICSGEGS